MNATAFDAHVDENLPQYIAEVAEMCALPSVSAEDKHLVETAGWVSERLRKAGFVTREISTGDGPPAVWAEAGDGDRTLLFYNHYDVQPVEPLSLWESDPFVLTERNGLLFARGVADNKADFLSRVQAMESWRASEGELPVRVRWLIEGEEEVGSPHLADLVDQHRELLAADGCLWEGSGRDEDDRPTIYCGVRGMLYVELRASALERDLHSMLGGMVQSGPWRLIEALRSIRDDDGRIGIGGMLERVRPFGAAEREAVARIDFNGERRAREWGAKRLLRGLDGEDALEELLNRPTANIAGIWGGLHGIGRENGYAR